MKEEISENDEKLLRFASDVQMDLMAFFVNEKEDIGARSERAVIFLVKNRLMEMVGERMEKGLSIEDVSVDAAAASMQEWLLSSSDEEIVKEAVRLLSGVIESNKPFAVRH